MAAISLTRCGSTGPPYSPREALGTFQIQDGFQIELFANEPDVADPVALEFDALGRIYVVENSGYPLDTESAAGRVKLLEDTDGDGRPDRTHVFVDGLIMPTGVMAWEKGILVTDPPDVLYFEDSDGDGRADVRKVILTGFAFTNPQHTVSSPVYGLDNWIYLSHEGYTRANVFTDKFGDTGDVIHYPDRPDGPRLAVDRRSVRFRPEGFELEYLAGPSQFGQTFDQWGRLFTHNNSNHARHEVLAARYLERNPRLRIERPWHDMPDHGNAAEVYPITIQPRFEMLSGAGVITSACGLTLYLGGKFPGFENVSFVAEPVHDLVHTDAWHRDGATFVAKRTLKEKEFLASTDNWFRPVNFYIGPDGALYLLDYYREVIEHPEWTSEEVYQSDEIYYGTDRGRIYRIVPTDGLPFEKNVRLGEASEAELVRQLENANIWWRRTAQRLLVERRSETAAPLLQKLVRESASAVARVHALWTLEGLGKLDAALVKHALADPEPGVRENALILAEGFLDQPALVERLLPLADDPDPRVRLQWLATAGYVDSRRARSLRERLLFADVEDAWMQVAALSWPSSEAGPLLVKVVAELAGRKTESRAVLFRRLASMLGAGGQQREIESLLQQVARSSAEDSLWWREASLRGLAEGLGLAGTHEAWEARQQKLLLELAKSPNKRVRRAALDLLGARELRRDQALRDAVRAAASLAADEQADPERRADAINLLALAGPEPYRGLLEGLIDPKVPQAVQEAAVGAYGKIAGDGVAAFLLERWRTLTGPSRAAAAEALQGDEARVALLVEALGDGRIQPWMLTARQRNRLIMHPDPAVRAKVRPRLTGLDEERRQVAARYQEALALPGDAGRGREVFERACAKCHLLNGVGKEVGPDLASIRTRPPSLVLEDILMPNRSIAQTYEAYVVETADGRTIDGVIGPQGPNFVTLRHEDGEEDVIPRKDIKEMYASNLSAMPSDLESQVSVEEMADLLFYIRTAR